MNTFWIVILSVVAFLILSFSVFLILIRPAKNKREKTEKYKGVYFAHRGLHCEGIAENSLSAFDAACKAGFAIELDVRLSKDGELVVFHDDTLDRMTAKSGPVRDKTLSELEKIKLGGTEDTIPSFASVLTLVDKRVPLLVELKEGAGESGVARAAAEMLAKYEGEYIVESFNPLTLSEFGKCAPGVVRGILTDNFLAEKKYRKPMYFFLQNMLLNVLCKPDFIAHNHKRPKNPALTLCKKLFGAPTFAWTVKSKEDAEIAKAHGFDGIIFEGYIPSDQQ